MNQIAKGIATLTKDPRGMGQSAKLVLATMIAGMCLKMVQNFTVYSVAEVVIGGVNVIEIAYPGN